MAIRGRLEADFQTFYTAVDKAEVKMRDFAGGAAGVEKQLNKMADSFSGRKIIEDATMMATAIERAGGVTTLTGSELQSAGKKAAEAAEKMRALGLDVPPKIQDLANAAAQAADKTSVFGGAFGRLTASFTAANLIDRAIGSITGFATGAYESATRVADLAAKTGLSSDAIQKMEFAANASGASLEAFTSSAFKLSAKLAGSDASVRDAVAALGLSFDQLRAMAPEAQFELVVRALGEVTSEGERSRLGIEIFGKSFEQMASAVSQGYDDIVRGATLMSRETIAAADSFDDAITKSTTFMKALVAETLAFSAEPIVKLARAMGILGEETTKARGDIELVSDKYEDWAGRMGRAREILGSLTAKQIEQIQIAQQLGASQEQLKNDFGLTDDALMILDEHIRGLTKDKEMLANVTSSIDKLWQNFNGTIREGTTATNLATLAQSAFRSEAHFTTEVIVEQTEALDEHLQKLAEESEAHKQRVRDFMEADTLNDRVNPATSFDLPALTERDLDALRKKNDPFNTGPERDNGIWARLRQLEDLEGTYAPRNRDQYLNMLSDMRELEQLRQWAQGKDRPPGYVGGIQNAPGGLAVVGEAGPEIVRLPGGSDVIPNHRIGAANGGGITVNSMVINANTRADGDAIGKALVDHLRRLGQILPSGTGSTYGR